VTSAGCLGISHDFVILNALGDTYAGAATAQGGEFLRTSLWEFPIGGQYQ
jgi:hypothetical protein